MKILYFTPGVFDKGGISRYGRYQIQAMREVVGAENIQVLSINGPARGDFEVPFSVDWHGEGSGLRTSIRFSVQALVRALRFQPDLVWSAHVNTAALAYGVAALVGAKSVLNVYGLEVWSRKSGHAEFGLRKVPNIVADCHFTADYVRQLNPHDGRSICVKWDCVDIGRFTPGESATEWLASCGGMADVAVFKVLMLGRISKESRHKGWDRLIDIAKRLPDIAAYRFLLAGDGNYRAELEEEVRESGLEKYFCFLGSVPESELVDLYRYCDVFSLVSDRGEGRGEGIPLTPLEAAACAKPIIVGNQDGSVEAVEHGVSGFAIDPYDLDSHASILEKLRKDVSLRFSMGQEARNRIEKNHSYEVFRDKTEAILSRLAS